jgi:type I restriction enzyme S subunit
MSESLNGIPRDDWTKVTLGEIARNITENEYKPGEKGLDRCVGLEHLDPGSLKICRWSPITPEMSFTRRFYKGQILFGKRRAYQKKVALADFDGICSSDILVIEAKKENFIPEILPFIIQDDRFFEFAVGTSSGSLSPRTKWKFLADYEIWLPSQDEQRCIATTLWAAEDCIVKGERFVAAAERAKHVLMQELFSKGIGHREFKEVKGFGKIPKRWEMKKIGDLAISATSGSTPLGGDKVYQKTGIPLLREQNVQMNKLDLEDVAFISKEIHDSMKRSTIQPDDVLLNITGASIGRVAVTPNSLKEANVNQHVCRIRLNNGIIPSYVSQYLSSIMGQKQIMSMQIGSSRQGLNFEQVKSLQVPFPPLPEQRQIAGILARCDETIAAARANVAAAKVLKMRMINEMLGGN